MDAGSGGGSDRVEARRLLEIAEKHLHAHDLVFSKRFAERALEADPLVDGADQILAVADVLLASRSRVCNQPDWYAILHLAYTLSPSFNTDEDSLAIRRSFRRLAILLSPDRNKLPRADEAYRFVVDAFSVLSNPQSKSIYDTLFLSSHIPSAPPREGSFWTSCHACCHVFEYDRAYIDRTLLCQICMRPFHAGETATAPPIVHGIDMYYCAWGFIPLGFPGCGFTNAGPKVGEGWKPFYPVSPWWVSQTGEYQDKPLNAVPINVAVASPEMEGVGNFVIDLDATEDALKNLHDLPFM